MGKMKPRKNKLVEYRLKSDALGILHWQDKRDAGETVYYRAFCSESDMFAFIREYFGQREVLRVVKEHPEIFA